ncbi:MAG: hypothetical protein QM594_16340 [Niabella sp.]
MKSFLRKIREWVWPLIEKSELETTHGETVEIIQAPLQLGDENLELAFQLQSKVYEAEEDRRKGTESKAALFISSLSLATTIIIAANSFIWSKNIPDTAIKILVITSVILSIYTLRTVWFSVKVLERSSYDVLGSTEINVSGNRLQYLKYLIQLYSKMIQQNEKIVNGKVTNLVMAQEYYKRAIVIISIYSLLLLSYTFVI